MSIWCKVSLVQQMVINPEYAKKMRGWNNYRIEYFEPNAPYQDIECSIWLPNTIDAYELEEHINDSIKKLIENIPETIQEEIEIFEIIKEKPKYMNADDAQKRIKELEEELADFRERYNNDWSEYDGPRF